MGPGEGRVGVELELSVPLRRSDGKINPAPPISFPLKNPAIGNSGVGTLSGGIKSILSGPEAPASARWIVWAEWRRSFELGIGEGVKKWDDFVAKDNMNASAAPLKMSLVFMVIDCLIDMSSYLRRAEDLM